MDWNCLNQTRDLMNFDLLDLGSPTVQEDDTLDYRVLFGDALESKPFINLGSGSWRHKFWTNIDHSVPPYDGYGEPDINLDFAAMVPFPLADNSIFIAYTSHTLEHLTDEIVLYIFNEVHRVLKSGGVFRISVPSLYTAYAAFILRDSRYFDHRSTARGRGEAVNIVATLGHSKEKGIARLLLNRIASALGSVDRIDNQPLEEYISGLSRSNNPEFLARSLLLKADMSEKRPNQHINYFTSQKLFGMLREAGFRGVLQSSYSQSIVPLLRNSFYFDTTRPNESLWVEAVK